MKGKTVMFLDVPVIKIQPGPFRTAMVSGIEPASTRAAKASTHFKDMLNRIKHLTLKEQAKAHDPVFLAEVVHRALTARHPRAAYSVKLDLQRAAFSLLPAPVADPRLKLALRRIS